MSTPREIIPMIIDLVVSEFVSISLHIIDHKGVVRVSYALGRSPGQDVLDEWIDRLVKEAEEKK